jgi:hypothetical protein
MKKGLISALLAMAGVVGTTDAMSQAAVHGQWYSKNSKVAITADGRLGVAPSGQGGGVGLSGAHGCPQRWWGFSEAPLGNPKTDALLKVAMASQIGRLRIHIETQGCTNDG